MDDMEKDVKTVISAASTRAEDRGKTTALMEPRLIAEGSRHRTGLTDFAFELAARTSPLNWPRGPQASPAACHQVYARRLGRWSV